MTGSNLAFQLVASVVVRELILNLIFEIFENGMQKVSLVSQMVSDRNHTEHLWTHATKITLSQKFLLNQMKQLLPQVNVIRV